MNKKKWFESLSVTRILGDAACGTEGLCSWVPPHLVPLLGAQEVPGHVLGQHVGDKGLVPAPHLIDPLLLVVDIDLPEEECPGQLFYLQAGGDGCSRASPALGACQLVWG